MLSFNAKALRFLARATPSSSFVLPAASFSSSSSETVFPPPKDLARRAHIGSEEEYKKLYADSMENPERFWSNIAKKGFHWHQDWTSVLKYNFDATKGPISVKWFDGAQTNVCYNAVDRHAENPRRRNQVAFFWEGNDGENKTITYGQLNEQVQRFANVLISMGVKKGDRVGVYMPMVVELPIVMLACARIGAIHSVIFAGFSAESIHQRMMDANAKIIITADGYMRGEKYVPCKNTVDAALEMCKKDGLGDVKSVVLERLGASKAPVTMKEGRDVWWHEAMAKATPKCDVVWMDAEDPLFMLYTSGSTGKPKGVLHTTGGYMVYAATTFTNVFDYHEGDVYFCTADCGWITGHSYISYGPLLSGATQVLFEGVPNYPDASRLWEIVDKFNVNILYTAPTAIRALMQVGEAPVLKHSRQSLRVLGSVGEPINPEAWMFYHNVIGNGKCPIADTWWQTETGGVMISPLPGATSLKPGMAQTPFFGVSPALLDDKGNRKDATVAEGILAIDKPWPGMMRTIYNDHDRFEKTYFTQFPGYYFTGDGARRDADGHYMLTGRVDDVMNVSGHRVSTAEVESALVSNKKVAEAAVVPVHHPIKGEGIFAYVILKEGVDRSDDKALIDELKASCRAGLGAIYVPDAIVLTPGLPKTRSGKIMRRILRKIASREYEQLGDTSTLADPSIVETLKTLRLQSKI